MAVDLPKYLLKKYPQGLDVEKATDVVFQTALGVVKDAIGGSKDVVAKTVASSAKPTDKLITVGWETDFGYQKAREDALDQIDDGPDNPVWELNEQYREYIDKLTPRVDKAVKALPFVAKTTTTDEDWENDAFKTEVAFKAQVMKGYVAVLDQRKKEVEAQAAQALSDAERKLPPDQQAELMARKQAFPKVPVVGTGLPKNKVIADNAQYDMLMNVGYAFENAPQGAIFRGDYDDWPYLVYEGRIGKATFKGGKWEYYPWGYSPRNPLMQNIEVWGALRARVSIAKSKRWLKPEVYDRMTKMGKGKVPWGKIKSGTGIDLDVTIIDGKFMDILYPKAHATLDDGGWDVFENDFVSQGPMRLAQRVADRWLSRRG
jgi:hypothetical protein